LVQDVKYSRKIYFLSAIEYFQIKGYLGGNRGERHMTTADMTTMATDYRKRAQECVEIAQTARTPSQRTMLLHIAETWLRLAKDADGNSQQHAAAQNLRQRPGLN
jgi:hypothetical protein